MNETELTETLDTRDLLEAARDPGVYAIEVAVPDRLDGVREAWDNQHDSRPDDDGLQRLADAEKVAYVGASKNVYTRLCEHVNQRKRRASFLETFPVRDVVEIWPHLDPFTAEHNRALRLSRDDWKVWKDGELYG